MQEAMTIVRLNEGEVLFRRGDLGDAFYIIKAGQVRIYTADEDGQELTLATLGPGESFGEIALLDARPRSASVIALRPTVLHRLSRDDFLNRVHASPTLIQAVIRLMSGRVRNLTDYIERMGYWASLVAEGEYDEAVENIQQTHGSGNRTLAAVADAVKDMVQAIQAREERLKQELTRLRIQIDQTKREQEVAEITGTEYFQTLVQQAQKLRRGKTS